MRRLKFAISWIKKGSASEIPHVDKITSAKRSEITITGTRGGDIDTYGIESATPLGRYMEI